MTAFALKILSIIHPSLKVDNFELFGNQNYNNLLLSIIEASVNLNWEFMNNFIKVHTKDFVVHQFQWNLQHY